MKVPIDWLQELIKVKSPLPKLAEGLTMHGVEVEEISGEGANAVLTLGLTPNRGDCLSIEGVAQEICAIEGKSFTKKPIVALKGKGSTQEFIRVKVLNKKGCPRYTARLIRGVAIKPSPAWLQNRLTQVGLRPINNVVDATNYVMWEMGQPLHAFDYRFIRGKEIVVRNADRETEFKTLDGELRKLLKEDLLICDSEGSVALAGVMGGENSEVREETKDLVLESAYFDPRQIRRTSKRLGLISESSKRFEKGVDPAGVDRALHRLTGLIVEIAGGIPASDWIDCYPSKIKPIRLHLSLKEIERIVGEALPLALSSRILNNLGFQTVKKGSELLQVGVPTCRPDVTRPIDLIEEIVRIYGYDKLNATLPKIRINVPQKPADWKERRRVREIFEAHGFLETNNLSLVPQEWIESTPENARVPLANPLSQEGEYLRSSLIPSLLTAIAFNLNRQTKSLKLYELKNSFFREGAKVIEIPTLSAVATGVSTKHWRSGGKPNDFYLLKGVLQSISNQITLEAFSSGVPESLSPTVTAKVLWNGKELGWIGEIHPDTLKKWDIDQKVYAFELNWALCSASLKMEKHVYSSPSRYPYIDRDVAILVKAELKVKDIEDLIFKEKNKIVKAVSLFDLYQGKGIPEGKKSLAFSIRYADSFRTLTDEEVNAVHEGIITRLCKELSAELRK